MIELKASPVLIASWKRLDSDAEYLRWSSHDVAATLAAIQEDPKVAYPSSSVWFIPGVPYNGD